MAAVAMLRQGRRAMPVRLPRRPVAGFGGVGMAVAGVGRVLPAVPERQQRQGQGKEELHERTGGLHYLMALTCQTLPPSPCLVFSSAGSASIWSFTSW